MTLKRENKIKNSTEEQTPQEKKKTQLICIVLVVKVTVSPFKFKFMSCNTLDLLIWKTTLHYLVPPEMQSIFV